MAVRLKSLFSGLCHHVVMFYDKIISEAHAASIFKERAWFSETLTFCHITTRCHNLKGNYYYET
jgi:hypothetical protein